MRVLLLVCVAGCLAALLLPGATSKSVTLPKDFKTCKRGDNTCLAEAVMATLPAFVRGIPKLGVRSVDPMQVEEVVFDQGSGPVSIKLTLKNQEVTGLGQVMITSVQSEMTDTNFVLELNGTLPTVGVMGDYNVAGNVLVLPISGQGKNNITLSHVIAMALIQGKIVKHDGEDYISIDKFVFDFSVARLYIDLQNLFNGDKALGDNMAVLLNENWKIVLDELKPAIQEAVEQLLNAVTNHVFSRVPYAILFPKE